MREPTTVLIPAKWAELSAYLLKQQDLLQLNHWRIEFSATRADPGTFFQVVINRPRNHASIRASEEGAKHPRWRSLLRHELLHLVFDPIREEHDFQMAALQTERKDEYSERLLREIEKAVEHLSHVL